MAVLEKKQSSLESQLNNEIAKMNKQKSAGKKLLAAAGLISFLSLLAGLIWHWIGLIGVIAGFILSKKGREKLQADDTLIQRLKKGLEAEQMFTALLLKELPDSYVVVNDINIPINGGLSQIDHVVIGPQGLLAIETKKWSAEVTEANGEWNIKSNHAEFMKDFNPMKQSRQHEQAIKKLMEKYSDIPQSIQEKLHTQTVVVLMDEHSEIRLSSKENGYVFRMEEFKEFLNFYQRRYALLIPDEIRYLTEFFKSLHFYGEKALENLEIKYRPEVKCSECGSDMVLRTGKSGLFYQCSLYPECSHTINADAKSS